MNIEHLLHRNGPMLSTEVTKRLIKSGVSDQAARQRVSRANGEVYKLKRFPFPNRASFLYLRDQYKSPAYWAALKAAMVTGSPKPLT